MDATNGAEFNEAARDVLITEKNQSSLLYRQDALKTLQVRLDAAAAATRRLPSVNRAIGLADRTKEHNGVRQEIDSLPKSLASLTGQEIQQIRQFQERTDELQ